MILTECSFWYDWVHLIILSHFCLNLTTTVVSGYSSVIQIHSTGRIWVGFTRPHTAAYTHTLRFEWQRTQVERVELIFCEQYSKTFPASLSLSVEYIYIYIGAHPVTAPYDRPLCVHVTCCSHPHAPSSKHYPIWWHLFQSLSFWCIFKHWAGLEKKENQKTKQLSFEFRLYWSDGVFLDFSQLKWLSYHRRSSFISVL